MNARRPHIPCVQLLWFEGCPNHQAAEALLRDVMHKCGVDAPVERIEVADEQAGIGVCFPGSPTIRIDYRDVEPDWTPCVDCTPRCRLYLTSAGLRPLPDREWIGQALRTAIAG